METAMQAKAQDNRTVQVALAELGEEQRLLQEKLMTLGDKLLPVMRGTTPKADVASRGELVNELTDDAMVFDSLREAIRFTGRMQHDVDEMLDRVQL